MIVHEGHEKPVRSVAFSPDGKSVASGSFDKTIRTWETHNASAIAEPLRGHSHWIQSVAYSPLGNVIASGSSDETIRLWDVNTRRQLGQSIKGNNPFYSVAFSPDAKLIVSGGYNSSTSTVQLWDVQNRKLASAPFEDHTSDVHSVQFSPDGTRVVSGSLDKTIRVWDVERGATIVGPIEGHTHYVLSTRFSPDGSQIVSCSYDGTIRLWDVRSGEMIGNPYKGHTNWVCSVDFSPRGTYVVSGGSDNTVRLWDIRTGRQVDQPFQEHTHSVWSVAFSPCGQYVASGSSDRQVIIRRVSCDYPELPEDPALVDANEDNDTLLDDATTPAVSAHMSTQQIFDCLIDAGCIDLSSQMDSKQDTAMIVSGGGFGDIWMGQLHDGQKVAIKAWRTDAMEQCRYKTLKRAARELFYWSRMQHKNIHQLMGVILFKDRYLGMVSEWMENGDLHKYIREHPEADRYQLCLDVASGLVYMHSQSTVHGDLKAANVLVSSDGTARLSDFDFSVMSDVSTLVFTQSSNTRSGSVRWVAPEMLVEAAPKRSIQSDVYALGMTMLEIFTGDVPYPNCRADFSVIIAVTQGTLPTRPINQLTNESGDTVWSMLVKCWSRNLDERPSAGQVVQTLESHVGKA